MIIFRCEICDQRIPEDEHFANGGLCAECLKEEQELARELDERT